MTNYYCYLLKNDTNNKTYNGFTINLEHRLRQHRGYLTGGAKATKGNTTWEIYAYVTGFTDKINALQCEWRIKYPKNKKRTKEFTGIEGRLNGLSHVLSLDKWTSNSTINNSDQVLYVYVKEEYLHLIKVDKDKSNIIIKKIENYSELNSHIYIKGKSLEQNENRNHVT